MADKKISESVIAPGNGPEQAPEVIPPGDEIILKLLKEVLGLLSTPLQESSAVSTLVEENKKLRIALSRVTGVLREKSISSRVQERRLEAVTVQVESLKEVVKLTKDLLNIRNVEVEHLNAEMDSLKINMDGQRAEHKMMITKLETAMKLNEQLKEEYETQLKLFSSLKDKYVQRDNLMENINKAKEDSTQSDHSAS